MKQKNNTHEVVQLLAQIKVEYEYLRGPVEKETVTLMVERLGTFPE